MSPYQIGYGLPQAPEEERELRAARLSPWSLWQLVEGEVCNATPSLRSDDSLNGCNSSFKSALSHLTLQSRSKLTHLLSTIETIN